MSAVRLMLVAGLAMAIAGCGQRAKSNESMMKSEEFFKEIEAPVAMETNAESQSPMANAESPAASSAQAQATTLETPAVDQIALNAPESPNIQDIQTALKNAAIYQGKIDGVMGPKTKKAIREFQEKNGLTADGKVGPKTWGQLKTYYNQPSSAAPISTAESTPKQINPQFSN